MCAILKNDTIAFTVFAVLSFIGYYFGIKLLISSKVFLAVFVAGAILTVGFDTYNYKLVKDMIPYYAMHYVATIVITVSTLVVAIALPQANAIYSLVISVVFPVVMLKTKAFENLRVIYC